MARILINKSHLFHNLQEIESLVGDKNRVFVVLKDNAYGHGLEPISKLCNEYGIKNAVVRNLKEAEIVQQYFNNILILADTPPAGYSHSFHIAVNSLEQLETIQKDTKIHLKVDSGMHRNGITINELESAILRASKKNLSLTGIFTHYRNADEMGSDFFWQKKNFQTTKKEAIKICEKLFLPIPLFHSYNSSAIFRDRNCTDDMVRVGIALYGYCDNNKIFGDINLKPVLSLHTNKITTRDVAPSYKIGYGGCGKANNSKQISTYDIGYGDGFFRLNEKQNYKTPNGYDVIGRVSMDNLCLNSTEDEVCLFNDVQNLAKIHNTISYEILTSLKPDIKREII